MSSPVGSPLGQVLDVQLIRYGVAGFKFGELNTSGQLLIVALAGRASLDLNGRIFPFPAGAVAWLVEAEWLRLSVQAAPWSYLQIKFTAPALPAPPPAQRVRRLGARYIHLARELDTAWHQPERLGTRALLVHGLACELLGRVLEDSAAVLEPTSQSTARWWAVEAEVRRNLGRAYALADLCTVAGTNRMALEAAAKEATGLTPIRRLRLIRLLHAQTLMRTTNLLLKEVAAAAGYVRVHEFSRDYRRMFGLSPHKHRSRGYPEPR